MKRFYALSFVLGSFGLLPDMGFAASAETRKSPYFIDGIHCEGLNFNIEEDDQRVRNNYLSDDAAKHGIRTQRQELCEALFSEYGVEKFQWVSSEDLEKLSFLLKSSRRFATVDVRLEKSELQNHVHLVGKFTPFEKKVHVSTDLKASTEGGVGGSSARQSVKAKFNVDINRQGPVNPAPISVGVNYFNTQAKDAIPLSELKQGDKDVTLTDQETATLSRLSGYWGEAHAKLALGNIRPANPYLLIGLETTKLKGDEKNTSDSRIEFGGEIHSNPFIPSITKISLFYSSVSAHSWEIAGSEELEKKKKEDGVFFAGFASNLQTRVIDFNFSAYRSLSKELHYFYDYDALFHLGEALGMQHGLGVYMNGVRGAILPQHRLGLPDYMATSFYYQADRALGLLADDRLSLKVGFGTYDSKSNLDTPYERAQAFSELAYKARTEYLDVGVAFLYGDQRLY